MRQCWPEVSTTYLMWGSLGLNQQGFSNFTALSQKSIILLMLPSCAVLGVSLLDVNCLRLVSICTFLH